MLQRGGIWPGMGPAEALRLYARYYAEPADVAELLRVVDLEGVARTPWRRLSGGEQQRLSLALALVGRPRVALLDEPTAGVDPRGRRAVREVIGRLRDDGVGVVVTTHELAEAERVADRLVIVDRGRVVAEGTPGQLASQAGGSHQVRFAAAPGIDIGGLAAAVGAPVREDPAGEYLVAAPGTPRLVAALTAWLAEQDLDLGDLRAGRESLEDVFLRLTSEPEEVPTPTRRRGPGGRLVRPLLAQSAAEVRMTLRRGDSVLLALGIPVGLLVFFSLVDVLPEPAGVHHPVTFLVPGILALAVMSSAMVSLAIATGFERQYGVLKRLACTPLGRPALLGAKTAATLAVEALQAVVLVLVGLALGWDAGGDPALAVAAIALGTVGFAGIGLLMAGALRAELTLAAANGLYLLLLLLGGMVFPLSRLPGPLRAVAEGLPSGALSDALHGSLTTGASVPGRAWIVLAVWAVAAPLAAAATFRWE
jgi:ABC-2 type transport system permease protein